MYGAPRSAGETEFAKIVYSDRSFTSTSLLKNMCYQDGPVLVEHNDGMKEYGYQIWSFNDIRSVPNTITTNCFNLTIRK